MTHWDCDPILSCLDRAPKKSNPHTVEIEQFEIEQLEGKYVEYQVVPIAGDYGFYDHSSRKEDPDGRLYHDRCDHPLD